MGSHTSSSGMFPWGWTLSTYLAWDMRRSILEGGWWSEILVLSLLFDFWKSLHFFDVQLPWQLVHKKKVSLWEEMMTCESLAQCQAIVVLAMAMAISSSLSLPFPAGIAVAAFSFPLLLLADRLKKKKKAQILHLIIGQVNDLLFGMSCFLEVTVLWKKMSLVLI